MSKIRQSFVFFFGASVMWRLREPTLFLLFHGENSHGLPSTRQRRLPNCQTSAYGLAMAVCMTGGACFAYAFTAPPKGLGTLFLTGSNFTVRTRAQWSHSLSSGARATLRR